MNETVIKKKSKKAGQELWYQSPPDKIFMAFVHISLVIIGILVTIPLLYVLAASFSSGEAIVSGKVFIFPVDFNFRGYEMVLSNSSILTGFKNSIIQTTIATSLGVTLTILFAYPLSRTDFKGSSFLSMVMVITMFFSGGMIPMYLFIESMGLLDSLWAVILPTLIVPYNTMVTRTFIQTSIPQDLYESASLDGCSDFKYLIKIVIPLCSPIIAVIALLYAVSSWSSYFNAMMYLSTTSKYPLQVVLRNILILSQGNIDTGDVTNAQEILLMNNVLKFSTIVISCTPLMAIYGFVQKYFVKGMMVGAVKG